jgi:hypothetical protein
MPPSLEDSVRCMLRFGFPADFDRAGRYLHELILPAAELPPQGHRPMREVLEEIVGETIEKGGTDRIVIPLSEGNDSRGLLAAALRCVPKERIICVTFGREDHPDVVGARTVAAALGVEWRWIDVEHIHWSVPDIVERVGQVFARFESYASQAVVRLAHIERQVGPENLYLTGFLGGVITGGHLAAHSVSGAEAARLLLTKNATALHGIAYDVEGFAEALVAFARRIRPELGGIKGLTDADILDFGFRQSMRIRGTVCAYTRVAMPFEDPRWVRYWLDQPLSNRLSKLHYMRELRTSYPEVFFLERDRRPLPVTRTGLAGRLRRFLRPAVPLQRRLTEKMREGDRTAPELLRDFQINPSVRDVYAAMMDSFDRRGLTPEVSFSQKLQAAMTDPTMRNVDYFAQAGRVEAHLQAGTLAATRR